MKAIVDVDVQEEYEEYRDSTDHLILLNHKECLEWTTIITDR